MSFFVCVFVVLLLCRGAAALVIPPTRHTPTKKQASITSFGAISPLSACLFAPTQVWVTIAAKLNYDIVQLNKDFKAE